jgi:hypothetical protein
MHVKLLQTTFSDSHRSRRGRCPSCAFPVHIDSFQSFSRISQSVPLHHRIHHCHHLLPFLGNNVWWDPVVAYATGAFYVIDRVHARFRTSPWSGSGRSVSNLCSCFRCIAKVFVLRVPPLNLSLSNRTTPMCTTSALCNQWLSLRLLGDYFARSLV